MPHRPCRIAHEEQHMFRKTLVTLIALGSTHAVSGQSVR
jgi:hypothetical protein